MFEAQSCVFPVVDRILSTGHITASDQVWLLKTTKLLDEQPLSEDEQHKVREVLTRLAMGLVRVVD